MQLRRRQLPLFLSVLVALFMMAFGAVADEGWRATGSGIRVKTVVFVDVKVYEITHFVKGDVADKTKAGIIKADVDKKFEWKFLRDVDKEKVQTTARDAFKLNGFTDQSKIDKYVGAFAEMKEGAKVSITYDSAKKATTIKVGGGGSATIEGADFMNAVWSVWFGKMDQPELGAALIKKL